MVPVVPAGLPGPEDPEDPAAPAALAGPVVLEVLVGPAALAGLVVLAGPGAPADREAVYQSRYPGTRISAALTVGLCNRQ